MTGDRKLTPEEKKKLAKLRSARRPLTPPQRKTLARLAAKEKQQ